MAILAQVGGAIAGGALVAAASYLGSSLLFGGADLGMALLGLQVLSVVLGYAVGAGLGAAVASRLSGRRGQTWSAVLGGLIVVAISRFGPASIDLAIGGLAVAAIFTVAGAVVGNNLRLRR